MHCFAFRIDPSWSRFQPSLTVDWNSASNLSRDASQKPPKGHLYLKPNLSFLRLQSPIFRLNFDISFKENEISKNGKNM